ncbi:Pif-2 [Phenacoccus solenopsis nudivirus]|nr:Pif-2 [Phenacoccus solenopsis nudivirus]
MKSAVLKQRLLWLSIYFVLMLLIYVLLYFRFDKTFVRRIRDTEYVLAKDDKLARVLNASSIGNIPNLNIVTTNPEVELANECGNGPVPLISIQPDVKECMRLCANDSAKLIEIEEGSEMFFNQQLLKAGKYCTIGPKPECNLRTTMAMLTINSIVCRPRYPDVIAGRTGNTVVACNNSTIYDERNVLWDNAKNEQVLATKILGTFNIDELLPSGEFRYTCRFNGRDSNNNKYIAHPLNRLHPMRNYCTKNVYGAHPDVKLKIEYDERGNIAKYTCDCGNVTETRLRNIDPRDTTTSCSPRWRKYEKPDDYKRILTLPYECFNINSPITDILTKFPCSENFTERAAPIDSVQVTYSDNVEMPIESRAWDVSLKNHNSKSIMIEDLSIV